MNRKLWSADRTRDLCDPVRARAGSIVKLLDALEAVGSHPAEHYTIAAIENECSGLMHAAGELHRAYADASDFCVCKSIQPPDEAVWDERTDIDPETLVCRRCGKRYV